VSATLKLDPRDVSTAYLWLEGGQRIERCELTPKYRIRFAGRMLDEVLDDRERGRIARRDGRGRRDQALAEFHATQDHRDAEAAAARQEEHGESKVIPIVRGQREARKAERDVLRRDPAFTGKDPPAYEPPAVADDDDEYIPFPS
jgi:hypothetical protein